MKKGLKTSKLLTRLSKDTVIINRSPVLTLWAYVVALNLGVDESLALSFGRGVATFLAEKRGARLGILDDHLPVKNGVFTLAGLPCRVVKHNAKEIYPINKAGKLIDSKGTEEYLRKSFGPHLCRVMQELTTLAEAHKEHIEKYAYKLYEYFRPEVPIGTEGWGRRGILDLRLIQRLHKWTPPASRKRKLGSVRMNGVSSGKKP